MEQYMEDDNETVLTNSLATNQKIIYEEKKDDMEYYCKLLYGIDDFQIEMTGSTESPQE